VQILRAPGNALVVAELVHLICKGQFIIDGAASMKFAEQFIPLAGLVRPVLDNYFSNKKYLLLFANATQPKPALP
jgi:hypothetical protein